MPYRALFSLIKYLLKCVYLFNNKMLLKSLVHERRALQFELKNRSKKNSKSKRNKSVNGCCYIGM